MLKLALFAETIVGLTVFALLVTWAATMVLTLYRAEAWLADGLSYRFSAYSTLEAGSVLLTDLRYLLAEGVALALIHMLSGIRAGLMR